MPQLSPHDVAIWQTWYINELFDAGRLEEWPAAPQHFPLQQSGERVLAQGGFVLSNYQPIGDGSYVQSNGMFFAYGRHAAAFTIGAVAGHAIGNSRRRRQAERDAIPRWVQIGQGQIWATQFGFYCQEAASFYSWNHWAVNSMHLVGPGHLNLQGDSSDGPINWILSSDWAELIFTMWARHRHPQHPQFTTPGWIPPGWLDNLQRAGQGPPPLLTAETPLRKILGQ